MAQVTNPVFYTSSTAIPSVPTGTPVNAVAATGSIGTNGTQVADGNTWVVNGKTYTAKTTMTATEGEIHIGAAADDTALNLAHAINNSGGTPGTDYQVAAANPDFSASTTISSNRFTITAKIKGVVGNALTLAKTGTNTSVNGATVASGGIDGTVGVAGQEYFDSTYYYLAVAANTTADTNWRRIAVGSAY